MIVHALSSCDARCPWCAREFWRWLRGRMHNPVALVASTSVRPPRERNGEHFVSSVSRIVP